MKNRIINFMQHVERRILNLQYWILKFQDFFCNYWIWCVCLPKCFNLSIIKTLLMMAFIFSYMYIRMLLLMMEFPLINYQNIFLNYGNSKSPCHSHRITIMVLFRPKFSSGALNSILSINKLLKSILLPFISQNEVVSL